MVKKNFYCVKAGRKTGVFKTWKECSESVKGYSGAVYKGFATLKEAEDYMNGYSEAAESSHGADSSDAKGVDFPVAFVDGSYDAKNNVYSYGVAILKPDGELITFSGTGAKPEAAVERNIAGELLGAMTAIKWCYENNYKKILIKHDYEGIARWAKGEWQAKKYCSTHYVNFISKYRGKITICFEKVLAHSGVYHNELADTLAKTAIQRYITHRGTNST